MKKKILLVLALVLLMTVSCGKKTKEESVESEKESSSGSKIESTAIATSNDYELMNLSFEDVCRNSDVCVLAEYENVIPGEKYTEFKFKVKKVICGQLHDDEIYLFTIPGNVRVNGTNYTFVSGEEKYTKGMEYILILERFQMTFYAHDRYQQAADIMIVPKENKYVINGKKMNYTDESELEEDIKKYYSSVQHDILPEPKTYENVEEQMQAEADVIAVVRINRLISEGIYHDGNNYSCTLEKIEKNECSWIKEGMEIEIVLERGTVEEGKSYRIGFEPADKNSEGLIFIQTVIGTIKRGE